MHPTHRQVAGARAARRSGERLAFALFLACGVVLAPGRVTAATNGVTLGQLAQWEIIVATDAIPAEVYAAGELRNFLAQAMGSNGPVRTEASAEAGRIFVGPGAAMRASAAGFDTAAFGAEDLRIVIATNAIVIAGGRPRGTLYGVYAFLEDDLGVRFLTADHSHVPRGEAGRVLGPGDRFYHPPLAFRSSLCEEMERNEWFAARLRSHTGRMQAPEVGGRCGLTLINHSFNRLLPTSQYGADHSAYYGLVAGRRRNRVSEDWGSRGNQPCLTNPDVRRIVTAGVLAELRDHPGAANVSVSQNDNDFYCRCPACAALDTRAGSPMGSLLTFVNQVADRVAQDFPGVWVGTLAYDYSRQPPAGIVPRPNVQIQLCSDACCLLHPFASAACPLNAPFRDEFDAWSRICDKVTLWSYNVNFADYLLPCPNLRVIAPNIRYAVAHGAKGMLLEGAYNGPGAEFSELRNYVTSRLLWDPQLSGDALINEFLDLHYGPAAPPIRRFIDFVHDHAAQAGVHHRFAGSAADFGVDAAVAGAGLAAFAEAGQLADSDVIRQRVEKASVCAYRAALEPVWNRRMPSFFASAQEQEFRRLAQRLFALCDTYGISKVSERQDTRDARARLAFVLQFDDAPGTP